MIVNKYITALLVALAATGMEAQTYQHALKFALTDISYDEFIQQPEARALKEDILSIIKAIKEAEEGEDATTQHFFASANISTDISAIPSDISPTICYYSVTSHKYKAPYGSIVIRGPNK